MSTSPQFVNTRNILQLEVDDISVRVPFVDSRYNDNEGLDVLHISFYSTSPYLYLLTFYDGSTDDPVRHLTGFFSLT